MVHNKLSIIFILATAAVVIVVALPVNSITKYNNKFAPGAVPPPHVAAAIAHTHEETSAHAHDKGPLPSNSHLTLGDSSKREPAQPPTHYASESSDPINISGPKGFVSLMPETHPHSPETHPPHNPETHPPHSPETHPPHSPETHHPHEAPSPPHVAAAIAHTHETTSDHTHEAASAHAHEAASPPHVAAPVHSTPHRTQSLNVDIGPSSSNKGKEKQAAPPVS
jgi:hypothetical protein